MNKCTWKTLKGGRRVLIAPDGTICGGSVPKSWHGQKLQDEPWKDKAKKRKGLDLNFATYDEKLNMLNIRLDTKDKPTLKDWNSYQVFIDVVMKGRGKVDIAVTDERNHVVYADTYEARHGIDRAKEYFEGAKQYHEADFQERHKAVELDPVKHLDVDAFVLAPRDDTKHTLLKKDINKYATMVYHNINNNKFYFGRDGAEHVITNGVSILFCNREQFYAFVDRWNKYKRMPNIDRDIKNNIVYELWDGKIMEFGKSVENLFRFNAAHLRYFVHHTTIAKEEVIEGIKHTIRLYAMLHKEPEELSNMKYYNIVDFGLSFDKYSEFAEKFTQHTPGVMKPIYCTDAGGNIVFVYTPVKAKDSLDVYIKRYKEMSK